jgi:hypothetical protein
MSPQEQYFDAFKGDLCNYPMDVQSFALDLLAKAPDPYSKSFLCKMAQKDDWLSNNAIRLLKPYTDNQVKNMLVKIGLQDTSKELRKRELIASVLCGAPDTSLIDFFKTAVTQSNSDCIADSLLTLGNTISGKIESWATDTSFWVRYCACKILGKLDCRKYQNILLPMVKNDSTFIQRAAINSLSFCCDTAITFQLEKLISDTVNLAHAFNRYKDSVRNLLSLNLVPDLLHAVQNKVTDIVLLNKLNPLINYEKKNEYFYWILIVA